MAQLRCKNLSVGYEDGIVVSDVSFELNKGDYVCIVGENGAGKSSLLKGILGLAQIKGGAIEYGDGLTRLDVGYLPQQKEYQKNFPATVMEVVLSGFLNRMGFRPYYNRAEKERALEIIADFGMAGYVRESFANLSGGQKQRVLLARALCATDRLLLLDEPAAGLDPAATEEMYELLKKLNREKGTTILMVSHDMNKAVQDAGKILHVNKGSGCGYFGPAGAYLDSAAAKRFLGIQNDGVKKETEEAGEENSRRASDTDEKKRKFLEKQGIKEGKKYV